MKISEAKQKLEPIAQQAKADNDKYCFVYFSRSEDKFKGDWDMDEGDALILLDELIKVFGFDRETLCSMSLRV